LQRLELPDPWRQTVDASLQMIDELDLEIAEVAKQLRATRGDHPDVPLLLTAPGIGFRARLHDRRRDRRHSALSAGEEPGRLHRALPARRPAERYQRTKKRLGKQRGAKVAQVDVARRLSRAIWHMLTNSEPFNAQAPGGAALRLTARPVHLELRTRSRSL
jgi:transposase